MIASIFLFSAQPPVEKILTHKALGLQVNAHPTPQVNGVYIQSLVQNISYIAPLVPCKQLFGKKGF